MRDQESVRFITREFPYDMELIYGQMTKRFQKHTNLCRDEITALRTELMRTQMALELAREEIQRLQATRG